MSKIIHLENEVNNLFRVGLQHLLLGFDPYEFYDVVQKMKDNEPWSTFIDSGFIENVLEPYAANWRKVISEFFVWDQDRFMDPVDQCTWIAQSGSEIMQKLFEGVTEDRGNHFYRYLEVKTALKIEFLVDEIETWAMTHKFFGDDINLSDMLDDEAGE